MKRRFPIYLTLAALLVGMLGASAPASISNDDRNEVAVSYHYLVENYYKPLSDQAILNSVRGDLLATLRSAGIKRAALPAMHASNSPDNNVREIDLEIERAQREAHGLRSAQSLTYAAIDGMMRSTHDVYTVFLTPKEFAALNQGLDGGNFGGIGIVIQQNAQRYITVEDVIPDGPADKAGIQQDDIITSINGISTKNMTPLAASKHLRGSVGTRVVLGIERGGKALAHPVTITRAEIHDVSVFEKMLPDKIGYIELTVFGQDTGTELAQALQRLEQEGVRAIVLDLRDNGGGYLNAAISVSSKFIPSGPIVSVEQRSSNVTTWEADDTAIPPLPLAVLVNGHTASASEITSAAIQDSGVGTIVGTRTFGKGVVQTIYPLPPDGKAAVKITTARYLTPDNRNINHIGIQPNIVVAENKAPRFGEPSRDAQLRRAIQYLDGRLARMAAQQQ